MTDLEPVQRRDYWGVALFTLVLYAIVLAAGGPLTLHEGVLSQTTKAMLANHDWFVPRYGEAPWLERPPLPQWISCAICALIGHCDAEWNVRIGPALAGLATVLLTLWLAGRFYGRTVGIISALALATMYNFIRYSTLAEADIMLAPIVAACLCAFACAEGIGGAAENAAPTGIRFLGGRPWSVFAFFVLLGMTNLVKGLVFGTVIAMAPVVVFRLWQTSRLRMLIFMGLFVWAACIKLSVQAFDDPEKAFNVGTLSVRNLGTIIGTGPLILYTLGNIFCFTRYVWLWGWLAFFAVAAPWPIVAYLHYPDVLDLWKFDLVGRLSGNYLGEPVWYYFGCLAWVPQPWTIAAVIGMAITWRSIWHEGSGLPSPSGRGAGGEGSSLPSPSGRGAGGEGSATDRFVWCWAWMPLLVYSMSDGKHHHYMLHYLAPWAILAAKGTVWTWQHWAERWALRRPAHALVGLFAALFVIYASSFTFKGIYLHRSREDTAFLYAAQRAIPPDQPLMINSAGEALEGLRMQFYLEERVYFLHNLSFVLDNRVHAPEVYVVTRAKCRPELEQYGKAEELMRCKEARREESPADRWTLYKVHLREDLPRKRADVPISAMQAMYRAPGPRLD